MRNYCTLFDSKYLAKGLVLYESLLKHSSEPFTLYVLALDDQTAEVLRSYPGIVIHRHDAIEKELGLSEVKANRTWQEYCWTLASVFTEFISRSRVLDEITYLDADLMFFSDPKVIFDEIPNQAFGSVAVIPHRLIPSKRHLEVNGKFNVCWVTFRSGIGYWCLQRWAQQCRDRCSASIGCGDQGYLDEWPGLFQEKLHVIQNIGAGLAPWNLANYDLVQKDELYISPDGHASEREVVFYHYHEFEDGVRLTNYELRPQDVQFIYEPYLKAYQEAKKKILAATVAPIPALNGPGSPTTVLG